MILRLCPLSLFNVLNINLYLNLLSSIENSIGLSVNAGKKNHTASLMENENGEPDGRAINVWKKTIY